MSNEPNEKSSHQYTFSKLTGRTEVVTLTLGDGINIEGLAQLWQSHSFRDSRSRIEGLIEVRHDYRWMMPGDELELSSDTQSYGKFHVFFVEVSSDVADGSSVILNVVATRNVRV